MKSSFPCLPSPGLTGIALAIALFFPLHGEATVRLAAIFGDDMVLQRDTPLAVWGTADPGEPVRVEFSGHAREATAGPQGGWEVTLPPLGAADDAGDLIASGTSTRVQLHHLAIGDVWWCSGQSNMEFTVQDSFQSDVDIAASANPQIRQVKVARALADEPLEEVKTSPWRRASPASLGQFTAVGYYFARQVQAVVKVPIGIINCTWSGTPIEPWMSQETLAGNPRFAVVTERWRADLAAYPERRKGYEQALAEWKARESTAAAIGGDAHAVFVRDHRAPRPPIGAPDHPYPSNPSAIFNGMVHPLRRFPIKGVLWYQGEANAVRASEYAALFQAQIQGWRREFAQENLSFYWVQIASYQVDTDWPALREAQARALVLPHTGQAVTIDIGEAANIHPRNKQEVGRRLALIALRQDYGMPGEFSGPLFRGVERDGPAMRVSFAHGAGLHTRGPSVPQLEVAGNDRIFHPAQGRINQDTLMVSSAEVPDPVAVRYAWRAAPQTDLYNAAGLPAAPFRSEPW